MAVGAGRRMGKGGDLGDNKGKKFRENLAVRAGKRGS
jgi:hypothetical protein